MRKKRIDGSAMIFVALLLAGGETHGQEFQVGTLSTGTCRVVDAYSVSGDDRGGIAVSRNHVFYTGDSRTGRFALSDLGDGVGFGHRYDALTSNLRTGDLYSLGYGDTPINGASSFGFLSSATVTTLVEIDPISGEPTGDTILLSTLIPATAPTGIFAGYDRVVLHTADTVYDIALPSGEVTPLGPLELSGVQLCESWAFWGVAEYFAGSIHLVYRESPGSRIVRTRVDTGETSTVAQFANLADMCSLTVSPQDDRWYFQHEGLSQLGYGFTILGFCDAVISEGRVSHLSLSAGGPEDPVDVGVAFSYTFTVTNEGPAAATGVRFEDHLPATVELVSAVPSQGRCAPGCDTLVCELGRLRVGETATVTLDVLPLRGGRVRNPATVFSNEIDPEPEDNKTNHPVTITPGASTLFSVDRFSDQLRAIDADTGATLASIPLTLVGRTIVGGDGLATHPQTGELWATVLLADQGSSTSELVVVDPRTGVAESVGETGRFNTLAFDADGTLYAATPTALDFSGSNVVPGSIYVLDPNDATATLVLSPEGLTSGALSFHPRDGLLYHAVGEDEVALQAIDLSSSTVTDIPVRDVATCSLEFSSVESLAHLGGDAFYIADDLLRLYRVTTQGERTAVGNFDHYAGDLAWVDLPVADFAVTQTDEPDPARVGSPLVYTVTVTNEGPELSGTTLFDPLPGTVDLMSVSASQGTCGPDSCGGLACVLGELDAGESATVTVEVTPWAAGTLVHSVSVPGLKDPDLSDNQAVEETAVEPAGARPVLLSIDRSSDQLRTIDPLTGTTLTQVSIVLEGETVFGGTGLAVHPVDGTLWALLGLAGRIELVVLDPGNGVATPVGAPGENLAALAFDADGTLYGLTESDIGRQVPSDLFVLSQVDAGTSLVRSFEEGDGEALAFNPVDGSLYLAFGDAGFRYPDRWTALDPDTLDTTEIPLCGGTIRIARALTHLGGDVLLLADFPNELKSLDTRGVLKTLGTMDHTSGGLAVVLDQPRVDLSVTQSATPDAVTVGEPLTLALSVTNHGPDALSDVTLSDTLPGTLSLASAVPSQGTCHTETCGDLECELGRLGPGESAAVTLVLTPFAPGTVTHSVQAPALHDTDASDNRSDLEITVLPASFDRQLLSLGTMSVSGFETATALHVVDPADATTRSLVEVTVEGARVEAGRGLATHPVTGEVWALLELTDQETSELVTLDLGTGAARRVGDTGDRFVALAFDAGGVLYAVTDSAAETPNALFVLDPTGGSPSFVVELSGGRALAFNPVDGLLYNASGRLDLEAVDPSIPAITPVASCGALAGTPTAGALVHGGGETLLLSGFGFSPGLYRLTTAGGLVLVGAMDHDSYGLAWADLSRGDLSVTQEAAPEPATVGRNLVYTLTVKNNGSEDFADVRLFDDLPATVRRLSISPSQGSCDVPVCGGGLVCELGRLAGGAEATVTVETRPLVAGTATNTVLVPALNDPDLGNNQAVRDTSVLEGNQRRTLLSIDLSFSPRLRIVDPIDATTLKTIPVTTADATVERGLGLATHPETGQLWALLQLSGQSESELVVLNPATGVARRVGTTGGSFADLAFGPDGNLYAVGSEGLYVFSQNDAAATLAVPLENSRFLGALAAHSGSGLLYLASGGLALRTVDPASSTVADIPTCLDLVSQAQAMTYLRGDLFLLADDSRLFSVADDGTVAVIGALDHSSGGLAFVRPLPLSDVSVTQSDTPDPVAVGERLTYTLDVRNDGPGRASDLTVFDELASTVSLRRATASQGSCREGLCGEIACELGDLGPGAAATVTVEAVPWAAGTVAHTAEVPAFNDPDLVDNRSVEETVIFPASTRRTLVTVDASGSFLRTVDPFDGSTIRSAPLAVAGGNVSSAHGLATHPQTGELWTLLRLTGQEGYELAILDPVTGEARRIGDTGNSFSGLAFDGNGLLYSVRVDPSGAEALFVLDQNDARPSLVLEFDGSARGGSLTFHPEDGLLFQVSRDFRLRSVDLVSLTVMDIPTCSVSGSFFDVGALTHLGDDTFLLAEGSDLYTLTAGGVVKRSGRLARESGGLAFIGLPYADLGLTQTNPSGSVPVGGRLSYTVTVTNHGPDDVPEVRVADTLPGTASLLLATPSQGACDLEPCGGLVCSLGALASGEAATIDLLFVPHVEGTVIHTAAVASPNDPDPSNDQNALGVAVSPGTSTRTLLSIAERSDLLRVIDPNDGSTLASVPVALAGEVIEGGQGLAVHPVTGELWALLDVDRGTSELVTLNPATGVATRIGNARRRFADLAFDPQGTLYAVTGSSNELYVLSQADATPTLVLDLDVDDRETSEGIAFDPESGLLYRLDGAPSLESIDLSGPTITGVANCSNSSDIAGALTWVGGDTLLSAHRSLYRLTTEGGLSSVGPLDHVSRGLAFVEGFTGAELSVSQIDAPDPAIVGSSLTYTLSVANDGPDEVPGVTVFDQLPGTVGLISAVASQGTCRSEACGSLACALGDLAGGARTTVTVEVVPLVPGTVVNTASLPALGDADPDDNRSMEETAVVPSTTPMAVVSVDRESDLLRLIDPVDGSTVESLPIRVPGATVQSALGLAVDPETSELWAGLLLAGRQAPELVRLDPATGVADRVGAIDGFTSLAFDGNGTLYGVRREGNPEQLWLYSLDTADATPRRLVTLTESPTAAALAFNPAGGLLYLAVGRFELRSINPRTLAVTPVASCRAAVDFVLSLTYLGRDVLLLADADSRLHGVTTGGAVARLGELDHRTGGMALVRNLPEAGISVSQTSAPEPARVGGRLTYTVTVRNEGPDAVEDLRLFDTPPATAEVTSVTSSRGSCSAVACGSLTCALGALATGDEATVRIRLTPWAAGPIVNTAFAPAVGDPRPDDNESTLHNLVLPGASPRTLLSLDADRAELKVIDPADASTLHSLSLTLPGERITGGLGLARHPQTGELWALLELAERQREAELVILDPTTGVARSVGNTGSHLAGLAFGAGGTLYGVGVDRYGDDVLFVLDPTDATASPVLSLGEERESQTIGFNPVDGRLYRASGSFDLQAIDPDDLTTSTVASCYIASFGVGALTHLGGDTLLLASRTLFAVTTTGRSTLVGTMDHSSQGLAWIPEPAFTDLTVTQAAVPDRPATGDELTYTLTVTNNGPRAFPDVTLFDTLPGTVSLEAVSASQGTCAAELCDGLSCELGELGPGEQAIVTVIVKPWAAGSLTNQVSVPALGDANPDDNQSDLEVTVERGSSTGTLFSLDTESDLMRVIDPTDGSTVSSRPVTLSGRVVTAGRGLATHPVTGELWALLSLQGQNESELVTLDPVTGSAVSAGMTEDFFIGLAFDAAGTLYSSTSSFADTPSSLFVLDPADATASFVLAFGDGTSDGDITFQPHDGRLYHAFGGLTIEAVDLEGLSLSEVALCRVPDVSARALTHLGGRTLLLVLGEFFSDGLYTVTTRGRLSFVGTMDHSPAGLAFTELPFADLAVDQTASPDSARVGELLTYTVTVTNEGPEDVSELRLLDALPGTVSLESVSASQGACSTQTCGGLVCELGALEAGGLATVTLETLPWVAGTARHTVLAPAPSDPDPNDNESVLEMEVEPGSGTPTLLSIGPDSGNLMLIDAATGSFLRSQYVTLEGRQVTGGRGLATHPVTGELWALLRVAGQQGSELAVVDPGSGVARGVGDTGDDFFGLAFDAGGTLHAMTTTSSVTPEALFTLSPIDAAPSFVVSLANGVGRDAIAFDPGNGVLYHVSGGFTLRSIAPGSLAVTEVAVCPFADSEASVSALTHLGGDTFLMAAEESFFSTALFALTRSGGLTRIASMPESAGLAFVDLPRTDLVLTQSDAPDPVRVGERLTYTLTLRNDGPQSLSGVTLFDTLPATADLVSLNASQGACGVQTCGSLACDLGEVEGGQEVTVRVQTTPLAAGRILSRASVPYLGDPDSIDNRSDEETTVEPRSSMPTLVSVGRRSDTLQIFDPATGAFVDSIPLALEGVEIDGGDGLATHPRTGELWALLHSYGLPGSELVRIDPTTGTAVSVGNTGDRFAGLAFGADATLYAVTDRGAATPESLFVLDPDDASPRFVRSLADGESGAAIAFNPVDGRLYHASGARLESIDTDGLTATEVAACRGSLSEAAALTHLGGDTLLLVAGRGLYAVTTTGRLTFIGRLDDSKGLAFVNLPRGDLAVDLSDSPDPATAGEPFTYTLTVENDGPDDVPGFTVSDTLPGTVDLVSATVTSSAGGACSRQTCGGLVCDLADVGSGEAAKVDIVVRPLAPGTVTSSASVSILGDPDADNDQVEEETTVEPGADTAILLSLDRFSGELKILDPGNGGTLDSISLSSDCGTIVEGRGLAAHPVTGELWVLLGIQGREESALARLDPISGTAACAGDTGDMFTGLAFDARGTLYTVASEYSATPGSLFALSRDDGTASFVVSLGEGSGGGAIAFHPPDGLLYHATGRLLVRAVDPEGPTLTDVASCPGRLSPDAGALTYLGGTTLLLASLFSSELYGFDTDGGLSHIGHLDHDSRGLAFVDLPAADLSVRQETVPDPVTLGAPLTYTLTLHNDGPDRVTDAALFDNLPAMLGLTSVRPSPGACETDLCGGLVCALGPLDAGEAATVTLEGVPLAAGTLTNSVSTRALNDPDPSDNESVTSVQVVPGAVTAALYSVDRGSDQLRVLDPATGATLASTRITLDGVDIEGANGLAAHPRSGELWALLRLSGRNGRELVRLDPDTGVATSVGDTGDRFAGLAFDAEGVLYGVTGVGADTPNSLFVLSRDDATTSLVGSLEGFGGEAIAFHPQNGLLYRATGSLHFESVDVVDLTSRTIPTCAEIDDEARALAWLAEDTLLLVAGSRLYSVTTSGTASPIGSLDHTSKGLALVTDP